MWGDEPVVFALSSDGGAIALGVLNVGVHFPCEESGIRMGLPESGSIEAHGAGQGRGGARSGYIDRLLAVEFTDVCRRLSSSRWPCLAPCCLPGGESESSWHEAGRAWCEGPNTMPSCLPCMPDCGLVMVTSGVGSWSCLSRHLPAMSDCQELESC